MYAPLPTSSPINVFQSLLEMCLSGAFFFLAWVKVANEGVWPAREQIEHMHIDERLGVSLLFP